MKFISRFVQTEQTGGVFYLIIQQQGGERHMETGVYWFKMDQL